VKNVGEVKTSRKGVGRKLPFFVHAWVLNLSPPASEIKAPCPPNMHTKKAKKGGKGGSCVWPPRMRPGLRPFHINQQKKKSLVAMAYGKRKGSPKKERGLHLKIVESKCHAF